MAKCPQCHDTGCTCGGIGLSCHGCCDCPKGAQARENRRTALAELGLVEGKRVDDLQTYIAEAKAYDPEFAKEYEALDEEYMWRSEMVKKDTEISRLKARVTALEEALRPFRLETAIVLPSHDDSALVTAYVRVGDIRGARRLLEGKG